MISLPVIYAPQAERQLAELRRFIEVNSGTLRAATDVDAIIDYCDGLTMFPERGSRRDDIFPGLRIVGAIAAVQLLPSRSNATPSSSKASSMAVRIMRQL